MEADDHVLGGDWRAGRWLVLLGACFYLLTTSAEDPAGDGALLYSVAEHLVDEGSLCAGPVRAGNTYLRDGCRLTDYGLGTSLVLLPGVALLRLVEAAGLDSGPLYAPLRALLVHLMPALVGGLGWLLLFVLAARLGGSRRRAFWLTLALGLTTTLWFYHRTAMSETVQTCALLGCAVGLQAHRRSGRGGPLLGAAAAFGLAVTTKAALWAVSPALLLYLAWDRWRAALKPLLVFGALLLPFGLLQLWFNQLRFGDVLDFGYHTFRDGELGFSHPLGFALWGYLFSPGKSFFLYNPVALLALAGWPAFWRRRRPEAALFLSIIAIVVFIFGRWWSWHGDWAWGPRFLVVLVPFACLPAVFVRPAGFGRLGRGALLAGALVAFWVQLLGCSVPVWKYLGTAFEATRSSFPGYDERLGGLPYRPLDDQLAVHHLPHFSPILGHWWLLKHLLLQDPDFARDHPWKSLGIEAWTPRGVELDYGLDWWGARSSRNGRDPALGLVLPLALLLAAGAGWSLRRAWRSSSDPPPGG
jgi:4-amino-4-deoxy-L-arabinose transferase-like glycosyltransferase